ncbi:ferric reductase NAD binding domain-containing protein [Cadophora sp. MPI-SDFR-AT-0126]|nr:ferric reductase NAD binding domain-containing protein [Leotiomycetes sp. MPI-SDFR-AT-0126]
MIQSIIEDHYTAARAYFFCVFGMLVFESAIHFPSYWLIIKNRGRPFVKVSRGHSKIYTTAQRLLTLPSYIPFLTHHALPGLARLAVFTFLNILWGWNSNEFSTDYKLYGWLTIANGGLALLTAARNNLFLELLRIPSTVLLEYHRWIGRATVIHATIHFALNTQHDIVTQQLADAFASRRIQVGTLAWVALALMFLTSLNFVRRRWFESFYYSHFLFLVFVAGSLIHATKGPEFLLPGLILWSIDRAMRFANNFRSVTVTEVKHYDGDMTKFKIKGIKTKRPGQIAWIQIPTSSLLNWHPFTISSGPGEDAVFAVRGLGGYTKKVQMLMDNIKSVSTGSDSRCETVERQSLLRMRIDGPYGVGAIQWGIHPVTVLVAGGIGITPGISIASHIIQRGNKLIIETGACNRWHVYLLWVIKSPRHAAWFEEELKNLHSLATKQDSRTTFDVAIYVTGSVASTRVGSIADEEAHEMQESYSYHGPGTVVSGRPDLSKWFEDIRATRRGLDAAVNVCGPKKLIESVRKAAAKAGGEGGIFHVEEEVFEF